MAVSYDRGTPVRRPCLRRNLQNQSVRCSKPWLSIVGYVSGRGAKHACTCKGLIRNAGHPPPYGLAATLATKCGSAGYPAHHSCTHAFRAEQSETVEITWSKLNFTHSMRRTAKFMRLHSCEVGPAVPCLHAALAPTSRVGAKCAESARPLPT